MNSLLAVGLGVAFAWFAWRAYRESRVLAAGRAGLLEQSRDILGDVRETRLPSGYMKVTGTYRGSPVVLEPVVDTLNIRKLPVLWLLVTVSTPVPVRATFDLLMRASGTEVFSPYHGLDHSIDGLEGYPEWSGVRTDNPALCPEPAVVARYLGRFEDGDGKELLITPKGLRMVVMVDQADRGGYLIFRDARFRSAAVSAETIAGILDDLISLKADLGSKETYV